MRITAPIETMVAAILAVAEGDGLAELVGEWLAAYQRGEDALDRVAEAEREAEALYPTNPRWNGVPVDLGLPTNSGEAAAFDHWRAQCAAIDSSFGLAALREGADKICIGVTELGERIAAARPEGLTHAALKYAVLLVRYGDGGGDIDQAPPFFAFLEDLGRLALAGPRRTGFAAGQADRLTLESYNAWLFYERRLLSLEMYPEMGDKAERVVPCGNPGDSWHFQGPGNWDDKPQPSTRAAQVLGLVGVSIAAAASA